MFCKKYLAALLTAILVTTAHMALAADLPNFSDLADKCGPAVVNIGTERKASTGGPEDFFGEMFFFACIFGDVVSIT